MAHGEKGSYELAAHSGWRMWVSQRKSVLFVFGRIVVLVKLDYHNLYRLVAHGVHINRRFSHRQPLSLEDRLSGRAMGACLGHHYSKRFSIF